MEKSKYGSSRIRTIKKNSQSYRRPNYPKKKYVAKKNGRRHKETPWRIETRSCEEEK
jgi:hypothetical protein